MSVRPRLLSVCVLVVDGGRKHALKCSVGYDAVKLANIPGGAVGTRRLRVCDLSFTFTIQSSFFASVLSRRLNSADVLAARQRASSVGSERICPPPHARHHPTGYGQNPYAAQNNNYGGYGGGPVEPYSPLAGNYEMGNMNGGDPQQGYAPDNQEEFFAEISEILQGIEAVKANISRIESLHQRSLTDIDESTSSQTQRQLDALVADTSSLNSNLALRIRKLKGKAAQDPSKGPQIGNLDRQFKEVLRQYQGVEANFQKRAREQMARQYRIVRPDATEEEVREACEDTQGQQVFSQALLTGNRRGEARSALREVQARHTEIQRIEKTIIELAQLFEQMEQLVVEQEPMVEAIEHHGEQITQDVGKADEELGVAVQSARAARRKKWWCLLIVLLIIIVIVIIVVVVVLVNQKKSSNTTTSTPAAVTATVTATARI
ncbi:hypothetical protein RUND412_005647 [Rhizina undulata]